MVAPIIPSSLTPLAWLKVSTPEQRAYAALPVKTGEPCFAVMLYRVPRRSKWRPRTLDVTPPMHVGKVSLICFPSRCVEQVLADCREFNGRSLARAVAGKSIREWAIAVSLIAGFDETAKPVDLLAEGGGA